MTIDEIKQKIAVLRAEIAGQEELEQIAIAEKYRLEQELESLEFLLESADKE